VEDLAGDEAHADPEAAAESADGAGLGDEGEPHVEVAAADRLHDPDLAGALEDRHDHGVHDPEERDDERDRAEGAEAGLDGGEDDVEHADEVGRHDGAEPSLLDVGADGLDGVAVLALERELAVLALLRLLEPAEAEVVELEELLAVGRRHVDPAAEDAELVR